MYYHSEQTEYKKSKTSFKGTPVCEAELAMWKDGKFSDNGRTLQKFCCPIKSAEAIDCPCHHKNFYNGKKNRVVQNTSPFPMI